MFGRFFFLNTKMFAVAPSMFSRGPAAVELEHRKLECFKHEQCLNEITDIDPWVLYSSPAVVLYSHVPQVWYGRVDLFNRNGKDEEFQSLSGYTPCELFGFGTDPRNKILHVVVVEGLNYVCVVPFLHRLRGYNPQAGSQFVGSPPVCTSVWIRMSNQVLYNYICAVREHFWWIDSEMKDVEDGSSSENENGSNDSCDVTPKYIDTAKNGWPYN